jgi:subtilisin-like proprotein convertase family protein
VCGRIVFGTQNSYSKEMDMKANLRLEIISVVTLACFCLAGNAVADIHTYASDDVPKDIPDPGTVSSSLTVPDSFTIQDVDVELNIEHTYDGDLDVHLTHNGVTVELFTDVGGNGNNVNAVLDDEADESITDGSAPFAGRYRPEGSLSDFDGLNASGLWELKVADDDSIASGTLISWKLIVETDANGGKQIEVPSNPNPMDGAEDVPVDTCLSWEGAGGPTSFKLLGGTGMNGTNRYSIVELQTDPVQEVPMCSDIGYFPSLDCSPDGTLYGASTELRAIDLADCSVYKVCGLPWFVDGIAFHPVDETLYATFNNTLYTMDLSTCTATRVGYIDGPIVWGIDFAPDGTLYGAFCRLITIDPATAQVTATIGSLPECVTDIDFAPDGYLYGVRYDNKTLYQIDLNDASTISFGPYDTEAWGLASCDSASLSAHNGSLAGRFSSPAERKDRSVSMQEESSRRTKFENLVHAARQQKAVQGNTIQVGQQPSHQTWDLYLGTDPSELERIASDLDQPTYCPCLQPWTQYYWKVVAKSTSSEMEGPVWSFSTVCPVDLNRDGIVNLDDLDIFVEKWMEAFTAP